MQLVRQISGQGFAKATQSHIGGTITIDFKEELDAMSEIANHWLWLLDEETHVYWADLAPGGEDGPEVEAEEQEDSEEAQKGGQEGRQGRGEDQAHRHGYGWDQSQNKLTVKLKK